MQGVEGVFLKCISFSRAGFGQLGGGGVKNVQKHVYIFYGRLLTKNFGILFSTSQIMFIRSLKKKDLISGILQISQYLSKDTQCHELSNASRSC